MIDWRACHGIRNAVNLVKGLIYIYQKEARGMDAKLIALKVDQLGYYRHTGESVDESPNKRVLLQEFIDWGKAKDSIDETKLVSIPHDDDTNLGYFFVDGSHNENKTQFTFVMWRESPTDNGNLYGVRKDAEPGANNEMKTANVNSENFIPGFPSYFWYDSQENILLNIVFQHSSRSKRHFELFLKEFLKRETDLTEIERADDGTVTFKHYVQPKNQENRLRVHPKVKLSTLRVDEVLEFLKANQAEITAIRRDEDLSYVRKTEPHKLIDYIKDVFSFLSPQDQQKLTRSQRRFTYEMDWAPTDADLDLFVEDAKAAIEGDDIIKDIKLKFKDNTYKSVKDISKKLDSTFDVEKEENEFISAKQLLNIMVAKRDELIAGLEQ